MSEPEKPKAPWERLPNESEEAWKAFRNYREMTPDERKITHSAARSTATLSRWYRDHNWEFRVQKYDEEFGKLRIEEREAIYRRKARELAIDHMVVLSDSRELVRRELAKWLEASRDSPMHGLVKIGEITKLLETVVKLDRLVRGETTDNVGVTDLDYSKLSLEELDALQKLLDKAKTKEEDEENVPRH